MSFCIFALRGTQWLSFWATQQSTVHRSQCSIRVALCWRIKKRMICSTISVWKKKNTFVLFHVCKQGFVCWHLGKMMENEHVWGTGLWSLSFSLSLSRPVHVCVCVPEYIDKTPRSIICHDIEFCFCNKQYNENSQILCVFSWNSIKKFWLPHIYSRSQNPHVRCRGVGQILPKLFSSGYIYSDCIPALWEINTTRDDAMVKPSKGNRWFSEESDTVADDLHFVCDFIFRL